MTDTSLDLGTVTTFSPSPGITLTTREWVRGQTPLLCLHGLADQGLVWAEVAHNLTGFHSLAPDLRGHGDSSKPARGYDFSSLIEDLESLLNDRGWTRVSVLAHSWGAKLALVWASQQPDRFDRLVLVDPFFVDRFPPIFRLTFPLLYATLPFLKTLGPFPTYKAAETLAKTLKQYRNWTPLQQALFHHSMTENPAGSWRSKFTQVVRNETFEDVLRVAGLTHDLDIPTLFIQPQGGINRTNWQLAPYRRYLKHLTIAPVPGNHWAFLVELESFLGAINPFLAPP